MADQPQFYPRNFFKVKAKNINPKRIFLLKNN